MDIITAILILAAAAVIAAIAFGTAILGAICSGIFKFIEDILGKK